MIRSALLSLSLFACATAFAQVDPNRVVATVNGAEIKGAEYYRRMEFLPGVGRLQANRVMEFPPGFMTLDQLITERLVLQLAREKGVFPSDLAVQNEIRVRMEDNPQFLEAWKSSGRTDAELNDQIRYELAQFNITTFGITITDQQVEQFYRDNPDQYRIPKRYKLRAIVVENEEAQKAVDADLAAGKPFPEVATARSVDVSKAAGGDFGTLPETAFSETLKKALEATTAGKTSPWIRGEGENPRRFRFLVEQILPAEAIPLDARLRRNIRRTMMLQRGQVKNDIVKDMRALRTKAVIDIKEPRFAAAYRAYIEALQKQGN